MKISIAVILGLVVCLSCTEDKAIEPLRPFEIAVSTDEGVSIEEPEEEDTGPIQDSEEDLERYFPGYPFCQECTEDDCPEGGACIINQQSGERFCSGYCGSSKDCPGNMICLYVFPDFICIPFFIETCEEAINEEIKPEPKFGDPTLGQTDEEVLEKVEENFPMCQECGLQTLFQCPGEDPEAASCMLNSGTGEQFCALVCANGEPCPENFECRDIYPLAVCTPLDLNIPCVDNF